MLDAISSVISKTIDVYLKINSSEERRRKFAKQLFEVYNSLDEVVDAIDKIQIIVKDIGQSKKEKVSFNLCGSLPDYIDVHEWSYPDNLTYTTFFLDERGSERISPPRKINQRDLLSVSLSKEIRTLNKAFGKIASIMETESCELWDAENKPKKLKAISIYDKELADTFIHAWFLDGGFIEALFRMGINPEFDSKILKLKDAKFGTPRTACYGYEVVLDETTYDLRKSDQIEDFLSFSQTCKVKVEEARDKVKEFIRKNCTIEDIL